jgi:hypothetical protein
MNKDIEFIHRLLDGEISEREKEKILSQINSDPYLKNEFEHLREVVQKVENCERKRVPSFFTSEVMRRLPAHKEVSKKGVWNFLFRERVLRWNMATAMAIVFFMLIVLAGIFQIQRRHTLVSYPSSKESTITVNFNFYAPQAKRVSIVGDFNKWSTDDGVMKRQPNGIWTIEIQLKPGTYNYMFVVDDEKWVIDPNADLYRDGGFGYKNSVKRVGNL